jgi:2-oxoglutarate ferredoxin oxidoreductase subunit delta
MLPFAIRNWQFAVGGNMARGTIAIDENRCKGCELCTSVCPKDLIHMATYFSARGYRPATLVDPNGQCTGCLLCATICPDVAITVYRETPTRAKAAAVTA